MSDEVPEQYRPRLCHIVKWSDFQGYGFNLHAEKGKAGQFIGKVDDQSPAEAAGLKEGDRIVEVNGVNIGNENHQQVVSRIKAGGDETRMLVVDAETDQWYKDGKKVVRGGLPEVKFISAQRGTPEVDHLDAGAVDLDAPPAEEVVQEEKAPEPTHTEPEVEPQPAVVTNGVSDVSNEDFQHRPRLCHLRIWPNFQGYGFNLHAERDKPGQYIGLVDENSPASTAGLRVNDRIIEVNGDNIEQESHTVVIAKIKSNSSETRLLVVDPDSDAYYKGRGVTVSSSMEQVEFGASPLDGPSQETEASVPVVAMTDMKINHEEKQEEEGKEEEEEEQTPPSQEAVEVNNVVVEPSPPPLAEEVAVAAEDEIQEPVSVEVTQSEPDPEVIPEPVQETRVERAYEEIEFVPPPPPTTSPDEEEVPEERPSGSNGYSDSAQTAAVVTVPEPAAPEPVREPSPPPPEPVVDSTPSPTPSPTSPQPPANSNAGGLELNLSVAEMKERLKSRKRQDPRLQKASFEQKYREFQKM